MSEPEAGFRKRWAAALDAASEPALVLRSKRTWRRNVAGRWTLTASLDHYNVARGSRGGWHLTRRGPWWFLSCSLRFSRTVLLVGISSPTSAAASPGAAQQQ